MLLKLPEYLVKRKSQIVGDITPHTAAYMLALSTAQPGVANPMQIWGNTARMFPVPPSEPLSVDAIADLVAVPQVLNYPYTEFAGPYTQSAWNCDFQYYIDSTGIVFPIVAALTNKQALAFPELQEFATSSGDPYIYTGKLYVPGPYVP